MSRYETDEEAKRRKLEQARKNAKLIEDRIRERRRQEMQSALKRAQTQRQSA